MNRRIPFALAALLLLALPVLPAAAAGAALTPDEQLAFADGIYLRGLHESALREYIAFARDYPSSPSLPAVYFRIGECYRHLSNRAAASRFYSRVSSEFPSSPFSARAALRRAELAIGDADYPAAAEAARPLLSPPLSDALDPDDLAAARYFLGLAELRSSHPDAARAAFNDLLAAAPTSPYASYAALELATLTSASSTKTARSQTESHFAAAVDAAATPSAKAEALFRWGDWAYRRGDWQHAADILQQLRLEFPDSPRARAARLASAWCLLHLDRPADAYELADEAFQQASDPSSAAAALYLRANLLRALRRDAEALQDYDDVLSLFPTSPSAPFAAYERMATLFRLGEWERAIAALPPSPTPDQLPETLWMLAESNARLGRPSIAAAHYARIPEECPASPRAPEALMRLAEIARDEGDLPTAASRFAQLADTYPDSPSAPTARRQAALALLRLDRPSDALDAWTALLGATPPPDPATAADAHFQRALVHLRLSRPADASADLDAVLAAPPSVPAPRAAAYYWRGAIASDAADYPSAERDFRSSLASTPDPATASLARLALALALQRQDRADEAADQTALLLDDTEAVLAHPELIDWLVRHRLDQERFTDASAAAHALATHSPDPSWRQIAAYHLGLAHEAAGNPADATRAYRAAMDEPNAATREGALATLRLAALELDQNHPLDASVLFEKAAALAASDEALDLRVRACVGLAQAAEAAGNPSDAARRYMAVAVLFDDPEWTPLALSRAAAHYRTLHLHPEAAAAEKDLLTRYPDSSFARQLRETETAP